MVDSYLTIADFLAYDKQLMGNSILRALFGLGYHSLVQQGFCQDSEERIHLIPERATANLSRGYRIELVGRGQ